MVAKKKEDKYTVVEDGKPHRGFPTLAEAKAHFKKRKTVNHAKYKNKGTLTLMALYKKVGDKWIGIMQN